MIAFADTSAFLKLFLDKPHTSEVRALFVRADTRPAVSRIAWIEASAALAQRIRHKAADGPAVIRARQELRRNWPQFIKVEVAQTLLERAAEFSEAFGLRAYDVVQLASAQELRLAVDEPVVFACFDRRLNQAAGVLGLEVPFTGASEAGI